MTIGHLKIKNFYNFVIKKKKKKRKERKKNKIKRKTNSG